MASNPVQNIANGVNQLVENITTIAPGSGTAIGGAIDRARGGKELLQEKIFVDC